MIGSGVHADNTRPALRGAASSLTKLMSEYELQHYLPKVYLKQFSATRKADIWRFDEHEYVTKPVSLQCAADNFYSSTNRKGAEEMFHQLEDAYGRVIQKIKPGKILTQKNYFGLILFMLQLHCRNIVYDNRTAKERAHACNVCEELLLKLMGDTNEPLSYETFLNRWQVCLLQTKDDHELITSDNPVTVFSSDETGQPHLVTMPVTPFCCAVAFDIRIFRVTSCYLDVRDEAILNYYQVKQCHECLFTLTELSLEHQRNFRQQMKEIKKPCGYVSETGWENEWKPNIIRLPNRIALSFLDKARAD